MRQAGFSIDQQFLEVRARVLPAPTLECREKQMLKANPEKGDWNMMRNQVNKAAGIERIFVVNTDRSATQDQVLVAINNLVGVLRSLGVYPLIKVVIFTKWY
jgi:hypothetical protein